RLRQKAHVRIAVTPIFALDSRPVAIERIRRQNRAAHDEAALLPIVHDADTPRDRRPAAVRRARAPRPHRRARVAQRGAMRIAPSRRMVSPLSITLVMMWQASAA